MGSADAGGLDEQPTGEHGPRTSSVHRKDPLRVPGGRSDQHLPQKAEATAVTKPGCLGVSRLLAVEKGPDRLPTGTEPFLVGSEGPVTVLFKLYTSCLFTVRTCPSFH